MILLTFKVVAKTLGQDTGGRGFTGYFCAAFCCGLCAIYFQVSSFSLFIHLFYVILGSSGQRLCICTMLSLWSHLRLLGLLITNTKTVI